MIKGKIVLIPGCWQLISCPQKLLVIPGAVCEFFTLLDLRFEILNSHNEVMFLATFNRRISKLVAFAIHFNTGIFKKKEEEEMKKKKKSEKRKRWTLQADVCLLYVQLQMRLQS